MAESDYDRGVQDQKIRGHDLLLEKIIAAQVSAARDQTVMKEQIGAVRMDLQRLTDAVQSNQRTVDATALAVDRERKATAEAVELQRKTLQDLTNRRWSPLARAVSVIIVGSALISFVAWFISHYHA